MMRLDKFLVNREIGSRSQVKDLIKKGQVTVNDTVCKDPERKIDEEKDCITCKGERLSYEQFYYYMLHKPQGVVTATEDRCEKTVMDLMDAKHRRKDLFPVGRLDKDTEGLLLITNDGELSHMLLSPKRHVDKTYLVHLRDAISDVQIRQLESGVDIGEERLTLPAKASLVEERKLLLTIHEGKFHQVKRMLKAVDNEVTYLKRISFGALQLDEKLAPGEYRALTSEEVKQLCEEIIPAQTDAGLQQPELSSVQPVQISADPMLRNIHAVIFDMDGSLMDSMWIWKQIDIEYLGSFGIELPDNLQSEIEGMSFRETAMYFKNRFPIPNTVEEMMLLWNQMAWDKYAHEVPLKKGAKEFLDYCREHDIKLGIASSNSMELIELCLRANRVEEYFTCVFSGTHGFKGKPAPDIYLAVAGELGVEPKNCLVFEDIVPGIMAGKSAGMQVCAVEDAYSALQAAAKRAAADYYITDFYDITV